jgi:hypothetical protein
MHCLFRGVPNARTAVGTSRRTVFVSIVVTTRDVSSLSPTRTDPKMADDLSGGVR